MLGNIDGSAIRKRRVTLIVVCAEPPVEQWEFRVY